MGVDIDKTASFSKGEIHCTEGSFFKNWCLGDLNHQICRVGIHLFKCPFIYLPYVLSSTWAVFAPYTACGICISISRGIQRKSRDMDHALLLQKNVTFKVSLYHKM